MSELIEKYLREHPKAKENYVHYVAGFELREVYRWLIEELGKVGITRDILINKALDEYFKKTTIEVIRDLIKGKEKEFPVLVQVLEGKIKLEDLFLAK